jgi:ADP-ribose pyrophosphatase YjhB (NUDIX family)
MVEPSSATRFIDRLWRVGLRVAFCLQRLYWFLFRPEKQGVYVAVWCGDRLLVIQPSYKPHPTVPAGGVKRGEALAAAAARELREEVGIPLCPGALHFVGEVRGPSKYLKDHCHFFEVEFDAEPGVVIDRREVVAAAFRTPEEVLSQHPSPVVLAYLTDLPAGRARCGAASRAAARSRVEP